MQKMEGLVGNESSMFSPKRDKCEVGGQYSCRVSSRAPRRDGDEEPSATRNPTMASWSMGALTVHEARWEQQASSAQFCQRQTPTMPGTVRLLETERTES